MVVAFVVAAPAAAWAVARARQQPVAARCAGRSSSSPAPRPHRGRRRREPVAPRMAAEAAAAAEAGEEAEGEEDAKSRNNAAKSRSNAAKPASAAGKDHAAGKGHAAVQRRFQPVSWAAVEQLTDILVERLRGQGFNTVLAVTRGGMVPATLLAQALELRTVLTATVIFYTDSGNQFFGMTEPRFLSFPSADSLAGRKVLIVDDVWDSGRTASAVKKKVVLASPEAVSVAVLHYKPTQSVIRDCEPDYFAAVADDWLVYPWERVSPHHADLFGEQENRKSNNVPSKT